MRLLRAGVAVLMAAIGVAALGASGNAATAGSGCFMEAVPSAGPVGTWVTLRGSTVSCRDGGSNGGDPVFDAENASVALGSGLPAHGSFEIHYRVPVSMASGDECCAALQYEGGGPVAPGPTTFGVWQGADISATFTVTSAPNGWADFSAVATQPAPCGPPGTCGGGSGPTGYLITRSGGYLDTFGNGPNPPGNAVGAAFPIVGAAYGPDQDGFWLLSSRGGVFTAGDVGFYGSAADTGLPTPFVAMVPTANFRGYWLVTAAGGVYPYGNADFYGQARGLPIRAPVVGLARTPDGHGYWLAGADGGVFSFGDAPFFGSMANHHLNAPVTGMRSTPDGRGYWLVARDGGVFSFGDAGFYGSAAPVRQRFPVVGMARTLDGRGYWLLAADGGIYTYGDAAFIGSGR